MAIDKKVLLDEAEAAYHALMSGQSVAEVRDHNGESIRYFANSALRLKAYILELKAELGLLPARSIGPGRGWF